VIGDYNMAEFVDDDIVDAFYRGNNEFSIEHHEVFAGMKLTPSFG
jgi:hypothetical protein